MIFLYVIRQLIPRRANVLALGQFFNVSHSSVIVLCKCSHNNAIHAGIIADLSHRAAVKMEAGALPTEALTQEMREETGLVVAAGDTLTVAW